MSPTAGAKVADVRTVMMLGLPSSGKTTFLAALWYGLTVAPSSSALALARLPSDEIYLNELAEAWLQCETSAHTSGAVTNATVLELTGAGESQLRLVIPDYSGETLREAWATRHMAGAVDQHVRVARGIVLLIHPEHVTPRALIEDANRNAAILGADPPTEGIKAKSFDLRASPTQTVLIDLLQYARQRSRARRLPVAVVVSAWDLVEDEGLKPAAWVARHLPLLGQFLATNADTMPSETFGVSAQGEPWTGDRDLSLKKHPSKRPRTIRQSGAKAEGVLPAVAWVLQAT